MQAYLRNWVNCRRRPQFEFEPSGGGILYSPPIPIKRSWSTIVRLRQVIILIHPSLQEKA